MMVYEMAYDPHISELSSDQISLSWGLNYYNINQITLNGKANSEIYGTIGGPDNFLNDAKNTICEGALSGTFTSQGSVSSTPIDFKIPGTIIPKNASGYIPLYNEPLGIVYWKGGATVRINEIIRATRLLKIYHC